jgi:outer membrane usher protein
MCRPPNRYRRSAIWSGAIAVALAAPALAQSSQDTGHGEPESKTGFDLEPPSRVRADGGIGFLDGSPLVALDAGRADATLVASPVPQESPIDEGMPAFLRGTVNEIELGDIFVLLRGSDALTKLEDLQKSGLHIKGGRREKRGEDLLVSLRSLAPQITFVFNEKALSLTITAEASLFERTVLDLHAKRPEGIIYGSAPSLFVNYMVRESELQAYRDARVSGFGEAGLSLDGRLLYASAQRNSADGTWQRLLTNFTFDARSRLTTIILGDTTAIGDVLGGGMMMGGLSVARNYGLDPYYVMLPTQRISGTALTPSTVEVYVNGQLVRREVLPPGQFSMQNLPVTTGSGETRVVVRDAFGAAQTIVNPYYMALGTLAKGLHDFSYNVGFARTNYSTESWNYGPPGFLMRHRFGLTDWLTVGMRAEGSQRMVSGGPSLGVRLPLGELGMAAAVSGQDRFAGAAALLSYSFIGQPLGFQLGARWQSREYATLSQSPSSLPPPNSLPTNVPSSTDRMLFDVTTSAAKNITQVASLSLQYQGTEMREQGWSNRITLMANRTVTRWMYAFATVSTIRRRGLPAEYDNFVGLNFTPADRVTAGVTRSDHWGGQSSHGGTTQAILQQSLPLGPGLGYRVVAAQGESDINQANAQYQGAYGRIEADYQHLGYGTNERGHATLTATGGLVLIGGRPFLTRPLQSSYALIRVPGVGGVHGLMSNQVVGTTDSRGDLLIPNLLPYYGNRIGIDDKDIPLDHDIGTTERTIAPPFKGGVVVPFPVRLVLSVSGTVVVEDGGVASVPAYGQIIVKVATESVVSPLDEAGNFYLENVPPGSYSAEVQYAAGVCTFPLVVAQGAAALVNVGTLRCIVPAKERK